VQPQQTPDEHDRDSKGREQNQQEAARDRGQLLVAVDAAAEQQAETTLADLACGMLTHGHRTSFETPAKACFTEL
jgi:hypothetical protein